MRMVSILYSDVSRSSETSVAEFRDLGLVSIPQKRMTLVPQNCTLFTIKVCDSCALSHHKLTYLRSYYHHYETLSSYTSSS
jgi:hypothetical protein